MVLASCTAVSVFNHRLRQSQFCQLTTETRYANCCRQELVPCLAVSEMFSQHNIIVDPYGQDSFPNGKDSQSQGGRPGLLLSTASFMV